MKSNGAANSAVQTINWSALTQLAKKYLLDDFHVDPDATDSRGIRLRYEAHVHKSLRDARSKLLELKVVREAECAADVFVQLVKHVDPMQFWPELTNDRDPERAYWEAHKAAAEERFGLPGDRMPDVLLQVIDTEFLRIPEHDEAKKILEMIERGEALVEAMTAHYGRPMAELTWREIDRFESDYAEVPVSSLWALTERLRRK